MALINQMNSQLIDIETRKSERLLAIQRQKNISFKPPKLLFAGILRPSHPSSRVINDDYYDIVARYEQANGRSKVKKLPSLGVVDFYSERFNGEPRYIIVTDN